MQKENYRLQRDSERKMRKEMDSLLLKYNDLDGLYQQLKNNHSKHEESLQAANEQTAQVCNIIIPV